MFEDFRLKVFMAVATEGSFTKAAAVLGISQPAVSQNIAELEKSSGRKFFERLRGEVHLTPEGEVFREYAVKMLALGKSASNMFSNLQSSAVKISVSEELYAYYLAPALESFITVHPEIIIERAIFEDADLTIKLQPSPDSAFEVPSESIARIRVSLSGAPKMGDYKATHERTKYFDVLFRPTPVFACTRVCRVLKDYLASLL
jgi:molybdenum-dependent DNA-binding transcriptional regulator ModE